MRQAVIDVSEGEDATGAAFMSALATAGLSAFEVLACDGRRVVLLVGLEEPLDAAHVADLPGVEAAERVDASARSPTYVLEYAIEEIPCGAGDVATPEEGLEPPVLTVDIEGVSASGVTFELTGRQATIRETVAGLEAAGADVTLRRFREYDGPDDALDALTERQQTVLEVAYELGYFDVPRRTSLDAVAAELGLDRSTVSEHLQRAERNLLRALLEG